MQTLRDLLQHNLFSILGSYEFNIVKKFQQSPSFLRSVDWFQTLGSKILWNSSFNEESGLISRLADAMFTGFDNTYLSANPLALEAKQVHKVE